MRLPGLPRLVRTTPFRLTLMFLGLFALAASAFLAYVYVATAGEATRMADADILREARSLEAVYHRGGFQALNEAVIERATSTRTYIYLLMSPAGAPVSGTIPASPIVIPPATRVWASFRLVETDPDGVVTKKPERALEERLSGGELLFVAADVGEARAYVGKVANALWGAAALVLVLGFGGGLLISRDVVDAVSALTEVIGAARQGDLAARVPIRGVGDELDELARGLNDMLARLERTVAGLKYAGEAIAHDLRSPLTRLRARLEAALLAAAAGRGDAVVALRQALEDTDGVLRTFSTVLSIAQLESASAPPEQGLFDPAALAADVAELYEPLCEDKGVGFHSDLAAGLSVRGNRDIIAQALANLLDNAVKYTPSGGAVTLGVARRDSGEIEFAVTDTGPGVPAAERDHVVQRFVRLEGSRNEPGVGLGLSLVVAVARAHGGRLELTDAPPGGAGPGPGLRAALVLPQT